MTKQEFIKLVKYAHSVSGITESLLEKDFYITNILRELVKENSNVIFKGGTSLSKAYKVINRFSEDVGVTLRKEVASQSKIREFNKLIENVCFNKLGLTSYRELQEKRPIRHKGMSNIYYLDYNSFCQNVVIKPYIELDSSFITKVDVVNKMTIQPMIKEILNTSGEESLEPFEIYVQPIEMIIADKFFAICKNYRRGNVKRYSRHFFDIYGAYNKIIKNNTEKELEKYIKEVAETEREKYENNELVDKRPFAELLLECCKSKDYEQDYRVDLPRYIYKTDGKMPTFNDCANVIKSLIKGGMFDNMYHYFITKQARSENEVKTYIYEFINNDRKEIKNLTQQEFQGKYCKNNKELADKKINELKELLRDKGKMFNETRYYMIPVKEGSNTYFIVGQNIKRTIALEIVKKELNIK